MSNEIDTPSEKSIEFSQESAKRIADIELTAEVQFYADADTENSNKLDENFLSTLENKQHLTQTYRKTYTKQIS